MYLERIKNTIVFFNSNEELFKPWIRNKKKNEKLIGA